MNLRATHTYVLLDLSRSAYDEIAQRLREAGYHHAFAGDGAIDMQGIAVTCAKVEESGGCAPPVGVR